jgi:septum formation topological specificity factor MinE
VPDDFKNSETVKEICKTLDGNRYYHDLYLKAVNHPIRRKILEIINKSNNISKGKLFVILSENEVINDLSVLDYNVAFLIKALCIEKEERNEKIFYSITQSGKIVEYLK